MPEQRPVPGSPEPKADDRWKQPPRYRRRRDRSKTMGPTPNPPATNSDAARIWKRSFEGSCMLKAATDVLVMGLPETMVSMWGTMEETKRTSSGDAVPGGIASPGMTVYGPSRPAAVSLMM